MTKIYKPAIFQPTVRPSWAGVLSYLSEKEKSDILEAIIKYPSEVTLDSKFWLETIKPDLDEQYKKFVSTCELRGRGAKTYWGEVKLSLSSTYVKDKDNLLKDKDKNKDKDTIAKKEYTTDFETFWNLYPKQRIGNKDKAFKAYKRVLDEKRCTAEKLLEAVKKYRDCEDVKKGYAKGCEAWLNDDRFNWQYKESTDFDKYWL